MPQHAKYIGWRGMSAHIPLGAVYLRENNMPLDKSISCKAAVLGSPNPLGHVCPDAIWQSFGTCIQFNLLRRERRHLQSLDPRSNKVAPSTNDFFRGTLASGHVSCPMVVGMSNPIGQGGWKLYMEVSLGCCFVYPSNCFRALKSSLRGFEVPCAKSLELQGEACPQRRSTSCGAQSAGHGTR